LKHSCVIINKPAGRFKIEGFGFRFPRAFAAGTAYEAKAKHNEERTTDRALKGVHWYSFSNEAFSNPKLLYFPYFVKHIKE
jgi:hypothetical protein